ncbi:MAG: non-canonical purine NTP pyrophosphatase [Actinomycetota bacterium]|nr:non-canonical purine NTP pyrophosphatase [Actinomycetota bacterium]MDA2972631.1 non-canonical purine NTP pyrophosphatase [Actinomycetota bacterium]MDA3001883.1 non-canonical purine NTP pyrophosphatase [Actinomycetota bacterium]
MTQREIYCASANPDKVREIQDLFENLLGDAVTLLPRPESVPDVEENADTLLGNARLKARAIVDATGRPAVADDTGLFVEALPGELGVRTARYASDRPEHALDPYGANRQKLLESLESRGCLTTETRRARFVTVAIVMWPEGDGVREIFMEGECRGTIASSERGEHGFGFDPLFVPEEYSGDDLRGSTFAELGDEVKNRISHRARAFQALATELRALPAP